MSDESTMSAVPAVERARASNEEAIRSQLRAWIVGHAKLGRPAELTDQTRLPETGLISSLDVVELVLFVEELRGEKVDPDAIEPELFASIDALWDGFFGRAQSP